MLLDVSWLRLAYNAQLVIRQTRHITPTTKTLSIRTIWSEAVTRGPGWTNSAGR